MPVGRWDTPIPLDAPEEEQEALRAAILLLEKHGYLVLALPSIDASDPAAVVRAYLEPRWANTQAEVKEYTAEQVVGGEHTRAALLRVNQTLQKEELRTLLRVLTDEHIQWLWLTDTHPFFEDIAERMHAAHEHLTSLRARLLAREQVDMLRKLQGD